VAGTGLLSGIVMVPRIMAQQCYSETQVAQGCSVSNQCLYLLSSTVYEKGTCSNRHQGHACGSKFTSIPTLHNSLLNTVFPSLKRGTAYGTSPSVGGSDVNGDGKVTIFDGSMIVGRIGVRGDCGFDPADVIRDGAVDFRDLAVIILAIR
jgi:hypothetical protein